MERTHKNQIVFVSTERFIQIISSKISEHVGSSGISHEPISLIGELFTSRISNALCSNHSAVIEEINIAFAHGLYPTYCRDGQQFLIFQKPNQLYFTLVKCFCPYVKSDKWITKTLCAPDLFQEFSKERRCRPLLWCFLKAEVHNFM